MDTRDRQAIEGLFERLANVERQSLPRDADAEAFIGEQITRQPHAPYYMAQTIVVQEQALNAAQARIEELEQEVASRQRGGLVSSLFGDRGESPRSTGSVPRAGRREPITFEQMSAERAGGGFLAGAAQTAMGVAGGVLLGNMIAGLFGRDQTQAAEPQAEKTQVDNQEAEDANLEDGGIDDGGFGDFGD
jgi:hypothetical protein